MRLNEQVQRRSDDILWFKQTRLLFETLSDRATGGYHRPVKQLTRWTVQSKTPSTMLSPLYVDISCFSCCSASTIHEKWGYVANIGSCFGQGVEIAASIWGSSQNPGRRHWECHHHSLSNRNKLVDLVKKHKIIETKSPATLLLRQLTVDWNPLITKNRCTGYWCDCGSEIKVMGLNETQLEYTSSIQISLFSCFFFSSFEYTKNLSYSFALLIYDEIFR